MTEKQTKLFAEKCYNFGRLIDSIVIDSSFIENRKEVKNGNTI